MNYIRVSELIREMKNRLLWQVAISRSEEGYVIINVNRLGLQVEALHSYNKSPKEGLYLPPDSFVYLVEPDTIQPRLRGAYKRIVEKHKSRIKPYPNGANKTAN